MANTSRRGFASMDPSKQREIASKGGRAAHAKGTAHEFTSDEARVAGRKGGEAVSRDRAHMSAIGREGGHSRGARARAAASNNNITTGRTDISRTNDAFIQQADENRSGFDSRSNRPGTGSSVNERSSQNTRDDRSDVERSDRGPLSGRGDL